MPSFVERGGGEIVRSGLSYRQIHGDVVMLRYPAATVIHYTFFSHRLGTGITHPVLSDEAQKL